MEATVTAGPSKPAIVETPRKMRAPKIVSYDEFCVLILRRSKM